MTACVHILSDALHVLCSPHVGHGLCSYYCEERKLQQWFNLSSYITLEPNSYSRRILNDQVLLLRLLYMSMYPSTVSIDAV